MNSIYRFIYLRVNDQQTAEDISANVFMKAWQKLGKYQFRGVPFRAWLFRIARNAVIDHYRTKKETAPLEAVIGLKDESLVPLSEQLDQSLEAEKIRKLIGELTEDQQTVMILKFVQGLSTEEVAEPWANAGAP